MVDTGVGGDTRSRPRISFGDGNRTLWIDCGGEEIRARGVGETPPTTACASFDSGPVFGRSRVRIANRVSGEGSVVGEGAAAEWVQTPGRRGVTDWEMAGTAARRTTISGSIDHVTQPSPTRSGQGADTYTTNSADRPRPTAVVPSTRQLDVSASTYPNVPRTYPANLGGGASTPGVVFEPLYTDTNPHISGPTLMGVVGRDSAQASGVVSLPAQGRGINSGDMVRPELHINPSLPTRRFPVVIQPSVTVGSVGNGEN